MEMKKLLAFTILAAAAASISANAMDWRYGILASYDNTGTVWLDNGKPNNMSSTSGFSVGAMVGYDFIDYFGIQSGLMFSMTDINSAEEYEGEHFGLFGLDGPRTNAAIRRMKEAGLISSRRDGPDHVYFLNAGRFRDLARFLENLIKA